MSSYNFKAINKNTGEIVEGVALDDYFGRNIYGYQTKDSKLTMRLKRFEERYERINSLEEVAEEWQDAACEDIDKACVGLLTPEEDITERTFIITDSCLWEQNKDSSVYHPHAIEVVDLETGQVRFINSGARIKFVDGQITKGRTQEDYDNQ